MTGRHVISVERRRVTSAPLHGASTWRLGIDVVGWDETTLGIAMGVTYQADLVALVRMPMALISYTPLSSTAAHSVAAAKRIASRFIATGDETRDMESTREAFQLFRNDARITEPQINGYVKQAQEVVKAYWWLRRRLFGQAESDDPVLTLPECETVLYWRDKD